MNHPDPQGSIYARKWKGYKRPLQRLEAWAHPIFVVAYCLGARAASHGTALAIVPFIAGLLTTVGLLASAVFINDVPRGGLSLGC